MGSWTETKYAALAAIPDTGVSMLICRVVRYVYLLDQDFCIGKIENGPGFGVGLKIKTKWPPHKVTRLRLSVEYEY